ncbi:TonB-dependent receptor [Telluria aromaticivorans]|uniref:TonB-dependent receptor n=1 Tax=Telluria aromaticivorans TaxID=2725995 RepID=A0A7Y2P040_9BURK|nr:TonB-dependent receptor [Telluria aromaticivorans]NNG24552.1 TonB-dependent receptor [Telluria aromaticivorans]
MKFAAVPRSAPALTPLALACALSSSILAANACAQEQSVRAPELPAVVITGARFPAQAADAPIGATVITADEIRRAGALDVNSAIRKIGGAYGRQSLDGSPDFGLDLRGFGSNSSQNLVILVDGVRMNENELSGATLASIPVDTVERIEITRGGSSVLYGEGATGGVINVITKRGAAPGYHGSLSVEGGRFDQHDVRASVRHGAGPLSFDLAAAHQGTDNYRDNNAFRQKGISGGFQWAVDGTRLGMRVDSARQHMRFPGSLTQAQFEANPRQTLTPNDFGSTDSDRVTAFAEHRVGSLELAAELGHREREVRSAYDFGGFLSEATYRSRQTQFSPRLRQTARWAALENEFVAGIDLVRWERATSFGSNASQDSKAVYLRDEMRFAGASNARLALGARHERFEKDEANATLAVPAGEQSQNGWSVEGSIDAAPGLTLHAKAGQSYRIPNADENGYRSTGALLDVQTSRDLELGVSAGSQARRISARVFRHRLRNEIFFDPTLSGGWGANTNLDPTRRQGVEVEGQLALGQAWRFTGQWQRVEAEFTAGPNAGREMVLVPKNVVTTRLAWTPSDAHSADIGAQWVGSQRYGNDFTNTCGARIPSYATVDARYAYRMGAWEAAVTGLNLLDRQYYSNAYGCRSGIYPSDGRQLKLSLRYDF